MEELIAKRYAKALMDLCDEKALGDIIASLQEFSQHSRVKRHKRLLPIP